MNVQTSMKTRATVTVKALIEIESDRVFTKKDLDESLVVCFDVENSNGNIPMDVAIMKEIYTTTVEPTCPDDSPGTKLAAEIRARTNSLTAEQCAKYFHAGMQIIEEAMKSGSAA